MNKLIIICGLPGTGKTTTADELSKKLRIFCLHKDTLKESIYGSFKMKTLEDSKKIGWPSVKGILDLAEENLKLGVDVILESTFNFPEDACIFKDWERKIKIKIFTIILEVNDKERKVRFENRERNIAHHDDDRLRQRQYNETKCSYDHMVGKKIFIKTNKPFKKIVE
jgi:predicted kinase